MATGLTIRNDIISQRPWGQVDKVKLARRLAEAALRKESGAVRAIAECFAYVPEIGSPSKWGGAHHELRGHELVVNKRGVIALDQVLAGARGGTKWGAEAEAEAQRHVNKHLREIDRQEKAAG